MKTCRSAVFPPRRKHERGAAIVESMFTLMILLLILFGLMQLFHLSIAHLFADYASFRGARSAAVGFKNYLSFREAKVQAIPASGPMTEYRTSADFGSAHAQFFYEKTAVERFMDGEQWLNYEYWDGNGLYHSDYHCPLYGRLRSENTTAECTCGRTGADKPEVRMGCSRTAESVSFSFLFGNYPFTMPMREAFTNRKSMDIGSEVKLTNHASSYLE